MTDTGKPFTHTAFAFRRMGKRPQQGRWLEVGAARVESGGAINVFLDRLPVGGFSGQVHLAPRGTMPPAPEPSQPQRPGMTGDDEDGGEEF